MLLGLSTCIGTRFMNSFDSFLDNLNNASTLCTDTKALWDNIVYNPATQTLAWEPACPVLVMVNLCRLMKSDDHCEDIQNSSKNSPEKVRAMQI